MKIRSDLPVDYHSLVALCRDSLLSIRDQLIALLGDPRYAEPAVQGERLRTLRRCRKALTRLESRAVATLDRAKEEDRELNAFVRRIAQEINHAALPPVVSPLSTTYFSLDAELGILFVPLVENRFLLHLPDIYHELGHQCFGKQSSPRLRPVAQALQTSHLTWVQHCDDERRHLQRSRGPKFREAGVELAQRCVPGWVVELYCDLFAIFTVGPAYAWSHLHLSALYGGSPYAVPVRELTTHPADESRMRVVLAGLRTMGFDGEAGEIESRWTELKAAGGFQPAPEFAAFYPTRVLEGMVGTALAGFEAADIRGYLDAPTDSVARVLNQGWSRFWSNPEDFVDWEQRAVDQMLGRSSVSGQAG